MQHRYLNSFIKAKQEQIKYIRHLRSIVTTIGKADNVIANTIELENALIEKTEKLKLIQTDMISKINSVENEDYHLLLTLRYLNFKTWEEISEEMYFSVPWVHELHKRALKTFEPLVERGEQIESKH